MGDRKEKIPFIITLTWWILSLLVDKEMCDSILEDLHVQFDYQRRERGIIAALVRHFYHCIIIIFPLVLARIIGDLAMFKSYFKIVFRNFLRNRVFSFIHLSGLAVGMTCFILIMLYVRYELSYDSFHENGEQIYRVACQLPGEAYGLSEDIMAITPAPMGPTLMENIPEIRLATRFNSIDPMLVSRENTSFYELGIFADEHFFDILSFQIIKGEEETLLHDLETIVISQRMADKFFRDEDPMGKILNCSLGDLMVSGVIEDVPENSHIQFDWVIPFARQFRSEDRDRVLSKWNWDNFHTLLLLNENSSIPVVESKMKAVTDKAYAETEWEVRKHFRNFLQPLNKVHTTSGYRYELTDTADIKTIQLFVIIAFFILIIACINAMNLTTAFASKRAKEINVRKTLGGQRFQLFWQFTGESLFVSFMAFLFAFGLVWMLLPEFNQFVGRQLSLGNLLSLPVLTSLLTIIFVSGFMSGLYPAITLSAMKPLQSVKQGISPHRKGLTVRNGLVLFQFSITILLIIASLVIFRQIQFIRNTNLGFDREQIVVMNRADSGIRENLEAFKNAALQNPLITDVTTSSQLPTSIGSATGVDFLTDSGDEKQVHYQWIGVDYNFFDVLNMEIVEGRSFSKEFATDAEGGVIVNEKFVEEMGWENPIGKRIPALWYRSVEGEIVGVVKNFHARSLRSDIKPVALECRPNSYYIYFRLRSENISESMAHLEKVYDQFKAKHPFDTFFLDDQFNRMYRSEQKLGSMIVVFSLLAIIIACLGIFGLAAFSAERRTKEIGIRKTLGASVPSLLMMISKDFTRWVLMANFLAWPIAYYAMQRWLSNYAYRAKLGIDIFILAACLALVIALLSVGYQSIKVALANPVRSLKYE